MRYGNFLILGVLVVLCAGLLLYPDSAFANTVLVGGDLKSKVDTLTSALLGFIVPAVCIFGLGFLGIQAAGGDPSVKPKIILVLCVLGVSMLAPVLINWIKGLVGY